jgi:hypothetical protein
MSTPVADFIEIFWPAPKMKQNSIIHTTAVYLFYTVSVLNLYFFINLVILQL